MPCSWAALTAETNTKLEAAGSAPLRTGIKVADLLRRQEMTYAVLRGIFPGLSVRSEDVAEEVEIMIKYDGYINRQKEQVEKLNRLERKLFPADIDYMKIETVSMEGRQKLAHIRPRSLGQASRISGVSPADITALLIFMEQYEREKKGNVSM